MAVATRPKKKTSHKARPKQTARAPQRKPIDPITAEVIRGALETNAFEMAIHVSRTATTPILNRSNERNATIMAWKGRLAALTVGIPRFVMSTMVTIKLRLMFFVNDWLKGGDSLAL